MIKRLGDICTFVGGGTPSKKNPDFYNGSIPWATVRDMNVRVIKTTEHSITPDAVQQSATNIIPKGEVVISTHVGLGKVCFLGQDTAINQDLKAVISNGELSRRYLYYWFISKADELIANGKGATVKGVTLDFVKNLKIQVLPEREQEVVSDTLDKVNHIIELADSQVARLDQLVKSRFVEMFGDLNGSLFPQSTIGEVCEVKSGGTPDRKVREYWENGDIPWVKTTELKNCELYDSEEHITTLAMNESSAKLVPPETILLAMYGQGRTRGMTAKLKIAATTNQACACILPGGKVDQDYLWHYLVLSYEKIRALAQGAGQPNLNGKMIRSFGVPLPPLALQREFAAFVAKVDKLAFAVRKSLESAEKLYRQQLSETFS